MTTSNKCQGTIHTAKCATEPPSPQLQALIDKAKDKRSLWDKTGEFFTGAWESTKRIAEASWNDPCNTGIGVAKGVGNLPSDLWNLLVLGSKYAGPIPQAMQADALNYAALQTYQRGDTATANALAGRASQMMQAGYASDIFEITGDAQKGGSMLPMLIPVGAFAEGASAAAKVVRGVKELEITAEAAKLGGAGADAAKLGETAKAGDLGGDVARVGDEAAKAKGSDGIYIDKSPPIKKYASSDPLFRGDGRNPKEIFDDGFSARGGNTDLAKYQSENASSIYVGTSTSENVAKSFAGYQAPGSYVYKVDPRGLNAVDVNATLGSRSSFGNEFEIAVVGKIPPSNIINARELMPNGSLGPIIRNPNYRPPGN